MTERKRVYEDDLKNDEGLIVSSKKKKIPNSEKAAILEREFDQNLEQMFDIKGIKAFQKEAIWRQMLEYKRESQKDKERVREMEERLLEWSSNIGQLCVVWEKTSSHLKSKAKHNLSSKPQNDNKSLFQYLISDSLNGKSPTDGLNSEFSNSQNKLLEKTQELCDLIETVANSAAENLESKDLPSSLENHNTISSNSPDMFKLQSELDISHLQIRDYKSLVEKRDEELRKAYKKIDRLQSPISKALDSGKQIFDLDENPEPVQSPVKTPPPLPADNSTEYNTLQKISEGRLAEIKKLTEEITKLKIQIDQYKIQANSYSAEQVATHPAFIDLEAQKEYYLADSIQQRAEREKIHTELEEMRSSRHAYQAHLQAEEIAQRQVLEQSLQKVQQDLMRVRSHRDQIQRELEERRMHDSAEDNTLSELQSLSEARRERIVALVLENRRLRARIAVFSGNEKAVEFYSSDPAIDDVPVTEELRNSLISAKEKISELQKMVLQYKGDKSDIQSDSDNTVPNNVDMTSLSSEDDIKLLPEAMRLSNNQNYIINGDSEDSKDCTMLNNEVLEIKKKLRVVSLEKEELEKTSALMEREMQAITSAFSKLEEQITHKVLNLQSKEQMIHKLILEKAKYEEKFLALNKDREAQKGLLSSLRFQNTKQLDHIKNVDERERNLHQQLVLLEQHLLSLRSSQLTIQNSLQDSNNTIEVLKNQLEATEKKLKATTEALESNTINTEKLSFELSREKENNSKLQRKLELTDEQLRLNENNPGGSGSATGNNLSTLVEEYKALLKCPTCRRNFKDTTLIRCMHVFCKECIDARIETRQRKCPTCGDAFGVNDVRQIYL
ncbi:hypothetical protein BB559_000155 [Furculomyces boomerangus]|uniref:E3 ubiquitin protein ligase n=1 Tax=Furculomyces boomerangus TaxID=61424 RepID=A0A2T9Y859_9FUNG|nr:hypothetical protein BB559_005547 [Furculomyces boomerangus]PVV00071.1 hypothetical protein BB559_000155 [Furculomyces boomerangus]